jgi:hypothetical protein
VYLSVISRAEVHVRVTVECIVCTCDVGIVAVCVV